MPKVPWPLFSGRHAVYFTGFTACKRLPHAQSWPHASAIIHSGWLWLYQVQSVQRETGGDLKQCGHHDYK